MNRAKKSEAAWKTPTTGDALHLILPTQSSWENGLSLGARQQSLPPQAWAENSTDFVVACSCIEVALRLKQAVTDERIEPAPGVFELGGGESRPLHGHANFVAFHQIQNRGVADGG